MKDRARPWLTVLVVSLLSTGPAVAQEEEFRKVPQTGWDAFYRDSHRAIQWPTDHQIYDIEINGGSVSAGGITHYLSGVSIQKLPSSTKETWIIGPAALTTIADHLDSNDARVLDIEVVFENGLPSTTLHGSDFYAVVARNRGSHGKGWFWWWYITEPELREALDDKNARLIDLELVKGFGEDSRYVAVAIENSGQDARAFWWDSHLTKSEIHASLADRPSYRARHLGAERLEDGEIRWNVILEETDEVESTELAFEYEAAALHSLAIKKNKRISSLAYTRYNSLYSAILVPRHTIEVGGIIEAPSDLTVVPIETRPPRAPGE